MATTKKIADSIYKTASITDRHEFRIEDIYYTGIIRKKAGLPGPKSITGQRFINKIVKNKNCTTRKIQFLRGLFLNSMKDLRWSENHPKETLCLHFPKIGYRELKKHTDSYKEGKLGLYDLSA